MSNRNDEIERLTRLRDRQLNARDPMAHNTQLQHRISGQRRGKKKMSFEDMLKAIPRKWWGLIIGLAAGVVIWIILTLITTAFWVDLVGLVLGLILAIVGFIIGQAFDARNELIDLIN
jgi:uncharacterized protein YacL